MRLEEYFRKRPKAAIAFSGGVDSAYLLYAALQCKAKVHAYYVKSAFQPQFELDDARRFAKEAGAKMTVLTLDVLALETITGNPGDRCYYCKKAVFRTIAKAAGEDGFTVLLDGTNASDEEKRRPGIRALRELSVESPLRECGLTKEEIRRLSQEAGLFTWNKPAYACLATRIPAGERITKEKLSATEAAETYLSSLGFSDFRVRMDGTTAKLQLPSAQLEMALIHRTGILKKLKEYYSSVTLDLEGRE